MTIKVGFIGVGQMGGALIQGLASNKKIKLLGFDLDQNKLKNLREDFNLSLEKSVQSLVVASDYIFICVKPHQIKDLCFELSNYLNSSKSLISIATGICLKDLKNFINSACPVVRVMPNICVLNRMGSFGICFDDVSLNEDHKAFLLDIFNTIGVAQVLSENLFDAYAAVIGSGPAYVIYFMMALVDSAITLGFSRGQATLMVQNLFKNTADLTLNSNKDLNSLKENVSSPAGSTKEALNQFDLDAVKGNIIKAIRIAYLKNISIKNNC